MTDFDFTEFFETEPEITEEERIQIEFEEFFAE